MNATRIPYKGRQIQLSSYELADRTWMPSATVYTQQPHGTMAQNLLGELPRSTQERADATALAMAQRWIDQNHSQGGKDV